MSANGDSVSSPKFSFIDKDASGIRAFAICYLITPCVHCKYSYSYTTLCQRINQCAIILCDP